MSWRSCAATATGSVRPLAADASEIQGVNDRVQLAQARRIYNDRLLERWMRAGVTIVDPATTWLDVHVTLEPDAEIGPSTQLEGRTTIASGARVGPGCVLRDTVVGAGRDRDQRGLRVGRDRGGRKRRPVLLPAPGDAPRGARQGDRHVRGDEKHRHRHRLQGAAPVLRRGRRRSASTGQHRRCDDLRQLRRRPQASHGRRRPASGSAATTCWSRR